MSRTVGNSRCTTRPLSSDEALSTTMTSRDRPAPAASNDCKHARNSAAVFQLTMTIDSWGAAGPPASPAGSGAASGGVSMSGLFQQVTVHGQGAGGDHRLRIFVARASQALLGQRLPQRW